MAKETKPKPSLSGRMYGETVYWGTIIGAVIAIMASTMSVIMVERNVIEPSYVFSAIWVGEDTASIWEGAIGALPEEHWYLAELTTGDGLTMLGLVVGVFVVTPGLLLASIALLKKREYLYGGLAIISGIISAVPMLGL